MKANRLAVVICAVILQPACFQLDVLYNENVKRHLDYLCPGTDICHKNAHLDAQRTAHLDAKRDPNMVDSEDNYISCCHGCSCHTDCHMYLNCCFPKEDFNISSNDKTSTPDYTDLTVNNEVTPVDDTYNNENANLTVNNEDVTSVDDTVNNQVTTTNILIRRKRKTNKKGRPGQTPFIGGATPIKNQSTLSSTTRIQTTRPSIDVTTPIPDVPSVIQCLYARTGAPDKYWIGSFPAYYMVSRPPVGGCEPNPDCQRVVGQDLRPTCDDDASFPWGDGLLPVFSSTQQLIFKNELCACCHGVSDYKLWNALVVCDEYDNENQRYVPISEHVNFLRSPTRLSKHCFLSFYSEHIEILKKNTCFMDTIDTCLDSDWRIPSPTGVNLSYSEITMACQGGLHAPFIFMNKVYKNVFCAMCSKPLTTDMLKCHTDELFDFGKSFGPYKITYLFDTVTHKSKYKRLNAYVPYPIACLKTNNKWVDASCRTIHCPSGQAPNNRGACTFPSTHWLHKDFEIAIGLEYVNSDRSVQERLVKDEFDYDDVLAAFLETSPWPSQWTISSILHTKVDYRFAPRMVIYIKTKVTQPEMLTSQIRTSMKLQWNISLDEDYIILAQSFLKYRLNLIMESKPYWTFFDDELPKTLNVISENIAWDNFDGIIKNTLRSGTKPLMLNKLFTCEQIALKKDEYTITAGNYVLINKLTNTVMFDQEFDLLDINGDIVPHVCLSDTPFVLRDDQNGAAGLQLSPVFRLLFIITLQRHLSIS